MLILLACWFPLICPGGIAADEFDDFFGDSGSQDAAVESEEPEEPSLTFDFGGAAEIKYFQDIREDNEDEDLAQLRAYVFAEGIFGLSRRASAVVSGLMEYDLTTDFENVDTFYRGRLWELYLTLRLGDFDFKIGQQIVSWGILDAINPVNQINPTGLSDMFVYLDDGYARQPLPLARATWFFTPTFYLESVWIPFFRPMEFDVLGTDWSLLGSVFPVALLKRLGEFNRRLGDALEVMELLFPDWEERLEDYGDEIETIFNDALEPRADDLANSEFGNRTDSMIRWRRRMPRPGDSPRPRKRRAKPFVCQKVVMTLWRRRSTGDLSCTSCASRTEQETDLCAGTSHTQEATGSCAAAYTCHCRLS